MSDYLKDSDKTVVPLLKDLNTNIELLNFSLKKIKFDEFVMTINNPAKMISVSFLIGFIRGLGFALGFCAILYVFVSGIVSDLNPEFLKNILK